ncbi:MAG: type II secretion system ATPase GspE [Thermodesulfobacteriota bacterium]|nr:type II secretion system ATPase GspE [Thermodesulfobacteriota bacterium]
MINHFIEKLFEQFAVSEDDADKIRGIYKQNRINFVQELVDSKIVKERDVLKVLSSLYSIPFAERLLSGKRHYDFTNIVSIQFLKKFCVVPLLNDDLSGTIALHDPSNMTEVDDLVRLLDIEDYTLTLACRNEIVAAINQIYNRSSGSAQQLVENMEENGSTIIQEIEQTADLLDDTSDAPVIKLVNHMISQSVKANASDIHIEPFQESIKIRYRIDGILYEMLSPPKWIQSALISRIKVMSEMNIAEKRIPQDGRMEVRIGEQEIDIRVSTIPTSFGERLVMRLLNKSGNLLALSEFGISEKNFKTFTRLIKLNNGIVLVTGPTGSGKTTTLYAALSTINSPDKNIITIEDPVEYNLKGISQIQVNRKTGVSFAMGLRSIVRQDPDVILVGEIRDLETAEIAIQSALTGHLVFSTLHTNDAAGAVTRLTDLGVEPYLITSSVKAVVAQRLVRVLCSNCKKEYSLSEAEIKTLNLSSKDLKGKKVFKAAGCSRCFDTGYSGREAVFEIMEIDDNLKKTILTSSDSNQIMDVALSRGMLLLRQNGIEKVLNGVTTVEEVLRVTQD